MAEYKIRIVVEGEDRASGQLNNVTGSLQRIGEFAAGNLLASGISGAVGAVGAVGGGLWDAAMGAAELNAAISGTTALAGGSKEEVAALKELVMDLGMDPNLTVTSVEAAEAINELVANGLTLQDVMGGAAEGTVSLANATGAQFATAATVASDTMSIFGIQADEMMTAVNGITGVVNSSKFGINDYALALAQGGGVAASLGVSFEDFNASITATSSLFSSGSDAGTSYKTFLQRLVPQSKEASSAMRDLGLEFFNADGSMKGMAEIAGELNSVFEGQITTYSTVGGRTAEQAERMDSLGERIGRARSKLADYQSGIAGVAQSEQDKAVSIDRLNRELEAMQAEYNELAGIQGKSVATTRALTEEEKNHYLSLIFGSDAMRTAAALAGYTEEEFAKLLETLGGTDAMQSAQVRTDNLAGDMDRFQSVLEGLSLAVGDELDPSLRTLYQSATSVLSDLSPLIMDVAASVGGYMATISQRFAAATPRLVAGATRVAAALRSVQDVRSALGLVSGLFGMEISFGLTEFDLGGLRQSILQAFNRIDWSSTMSNASETFDGLAEQATSLVTEIPWADYFTDAKTTLGGLAEQATSLVTEIPWADYFTDAKTTLGGLAEQATSLVTEIPWADYFTDAKTLFDGLATEIKTKLTSINWTEALESGTALWQGFTDAVQGLMPAAETWTNNEALGQVQEVVDSVFGENGIIQTVSQTVTDSILSVGDSLANVDAKKLGEDFGGILLGVSTVAAYLVTADFSVVAARIDLVSQLSTDVLTFLTGFGSGIDTAALSEVATNFATNFAGQLADVFNTESGVNIGESVGAFAGMLISKLGEALTPQAGQGLGEAAGGIAGSLATAAGGIVTGLLNEIAKVDWVSFNAQIDSFTVSFIAGVTDGLARADWSGMGQALLDGASNAIVSVMGGMFPGGLFGGGYDNNLNPIPPEQAKEQASQEWGMLRKSLDSFMSWIPGWPAEAKAAVQTTPAWVGSTNAYIQTTPGWVAQNYGNIQNTPGWVGAARSAIQTGPRWVDALVDALRSQAGNNQGDVEPLYPNATGASSLRGGWVRYNEYGGEVAMLPSGTVVMPPANAREYMRGRASENRGLSVTIHAGGTANPRRLAYRTARELQRHNRRR
jgi:TP901 family phage tail tape measure protein